MNEIRRVVLTLSTAACLLATSLALPQAPKKGDNLYKFVRAADSIAVWYNAKVSDWIEGKGIILKHNPDMELMATLKEEFYMAHSVAGEPGEYLIDTDGDSILDTQSEVLWLPFWVVKRNSSISASDKSIIVLFDRMYDMGLQSDDGGPLDTNLVHKLRQYRTDFSLPNRHIAYLFDSYDQIIHLLNEEGKKLPSELCIRITDHLASECRKLFGLVPVVVRIYQGEALLNARMIDKAREHFRFSLQEFPHSVPLRVYDCQLDANPGRREKKLKKLRQDHPNHWMVRDLR
ncbi:MAG TPA: hypothetical protein VNL73_08105 [Verrucomicrobiae bacterium]|nr:hypothetical protein [Verrucomicrobiae bacterium]